MNERIWPPPAELYAQTPEVVSLVDLRSQAERLLASGNGVFADAESMSAVAAVRAALRTLERRIVRMPQGPVG